MIIQQSGRAAAFTLVLLLAACGGGNKGSSANRAPTVDIEAPAEVTEFETVMLKAKATDADGDALAFEWTQTDGVAVELGNSAGTAQLQFSAPASETQTALTFTVSVRDGASNAVTREVTVLVNPGLRGVVFSTFGGADRQRIYRQLASDNEPVPLAEFETARQIARSPDGTRIAYSQRSADGANQLVLLDVPGGNHAVVDALGTAGTYTQAQFLRFSPDSSQLAFAAVTSFAGTPKPAIFVAELPESLDDFDASVHVRAVSGELPSPDAAIEFIVWSPDSNRLAVTGDLCDGGASEIVVLSTESAETPNGGCDTENGLRRVSGPDETAAFSVVHTDKVPRFSPDGRWLAYVQWREGNALDPERPALIVVPVDAATLADAGFDFTAAARRVSGDAFPDEIYFGPDFTWSPDAGQIAFSVIPQDNAAAFDCTSCGIYTVATDEAGLLDPDTDFTARRLKRSGDLIMLQKDFPLEIGGFVAPGVAWSPDGEQLAFTASSAATVSETENLAPGLFVVDAASASATATRISGSNRHVGDNDNNGLQDDGGVARFAWSPDAKHIAMLAALNDAGTGNGYVTEAWQVDVAAALAAADVDTARRRVSGNIDARGTDGILLGRVEELAWFADGRRLLFLGDLAVDGRHELFSAPAGTVSGDRVSHSQAVQESRDIVHGYALHPFGASEDLGEIPTGN